MFVEAVEPNRRLCIRTCFCANVVRLEGMIMAQEKLTYLSFCKT